ncbi:G-protein alpha subunit-domain-containing protein [Russula earlei]|uniref:G-protein alpha subunit-domain-containing protein n=1 Tax=Russula earlei TaxID=71964 RepID=A0ACC0U8P8_9AGAM|nr:G-protein alpha subunit-domain-containing protein [Russula earlei]
MISFTSWQQRRAEKRAQSRAKARSDEIDHELEEQSKDSRQRYDILLISTPGSEAEAFATVKQMKLSHDDCTNEELADFRPVIWKILLENSRSIATALRSLKPKHTSRAMKANSEFIMNHRRDIDNPEFMFRPQFAQVVQNFWTDDVIPVLLDHPSALSLADNAEYFFSEAQRIATEEYVPSIEDVYGQQGKFRKWIHLFEGVTSIMFFASLSDYDEPGASSRSPRTRLIESLNLFEAIVNSHWFFADIDHTVLDGNRRIQNQTP